MEGGQIGMPGQHVPHPVALVKGHAREAVPPQHHAMVAVGVPVTHQKGAAVPTHKIALVSANRWASQQTQPVIVPCRFLHVATAQ